MSMIVWLGKLWGVAEKNYSTRAVSDDGGCGKLREKITKKVQKRY